MAGEDTNFDPVRSTGMKVRGHFNKILQLGRKDRGILYSQPLIQEHKPLSISFPRA